MTETATNARPVPGPAVELAEIAAALRGAEAVVIGTHENPDGDAIGSARAAELVVQALGIDVVVYVPHGTVPREYGFIRPDRLVDTVPEDITRRTLLAVDCGNAERLASPALVDGAREVLNVDHHADNTMFGDRNVVRGEVACAAQLVRELARELDVALTPDLATAIYVGLVTDTGRFQYSNTDAAALSLAAELVEAGVDVHEVFRQIFERMEWERLKLLARGLERAQRSSDGRVVGTHLTQADFAEFGADDDAAEGIVDFLRSVEGTQVAVFLRDLTAPKHPDGTGTRKGSLRTTREDVDVSIVARAYNGGGHRQAAGFNTDDDLATIIDRVHAALDEQNVATAAAAPAGA